MTVGAIIAVLSLQNYSGCDSTEDATPIFRVSFKTKTEAYIEVTMATVVLRVRFEDDIGVYI